VVEPAAIAAPNVEPRKKRRRRPCVEHINSIVQVSDTRYRVERGYLNSMALRPTAIRKLGHASWHRNDTGEVVGFRVRRIRCGSPLHQAGIRNGDIIRTVNGREPRSLPQAIRLWFKMRKKTFVRVVLTRNGQEIKFKYRLT
jgi:S1-C subfamily serine protease